MKCNEEQIKDVTKAFNDDTQQDIVKQIYEGYKFGEPKGINLGAHVDYNERGNCTITEVINQEALEKFGTQILNDMFFANVNGYHLSIPSRSTPEIGHATALMIDKKEKEVWYHDSYGVDMPKEMKDFMNRLLPDYSFSFSDSQQQFRENNDQSCVLLSTYNLRDMWFKKKGMTDKICDYDSFKARDKVWNLLKEVPKEKTPETKKIGFKINKTTTVSEEDKRAFQEARLAAEDKSFKYRLYEEPNYEEILDSAIKTSRSNHAIFVKNLKAHRNVNELR